MSTPRFPIPSLPSLAAVAAGVSLSFGAHALTVSPIGEAALLQALGGAEEPALRFVGEGRIGDRGGAATFEYDVGRTTDAPAATGQFAWGNGSSVRFRFRYDAGTSLALLAIGTAPVLQYAVPLEDRNVNALFVRARAMPAIP